MPFHCSKQAKTSEKPYQDHQKDRRDKNFRNCNSRSSRPQGYTLATGVNMSKTPAYNNCDRGCNRPAQQEDKDLSQTTYYNYNKKGHFANQCPKLCKPKN